ncbi:MAG: tRNA (adenosine(37)-N6)-threonylcarbamoyltransferase complex dimerization subunit type 1 TsaB [Candidatus Krumholzibacteriia bacterium]
MLNLALDTATGAGRFALADGQQVLAYRPVNIQGSYADALLPVVQQMLAAAGRDRTELTGVGVTSGPGSFTGVRIGVATAKGLAWALGCELVAVSTLAAMAAALLAEADPAVTTAVPALDARRGEIFAAVYRRRGRWVEAVLPPAAAAPDRWWARLVAGLDDPGAPVYGGDGTPLLLGQGDGLRPELAARGTPAARDWSAGHPATAPALALAMGDAAADLPRVHPFTLVPTYLRVSDAEAKRHVDLTPTAPAPDVQRHRSGRQDP